jgi:hypothetical protein
MEVSIIPPWADLLTGQSVSSSNLRREGDRMDIGEKKEV